MRSSGTTPRLLGRIARALRGIGAAAVVGAGFASASVGAVALHLDLPPTRRVVREVVNEVLASLFQGAIVVDAIDHVRLTGVEVGEAHVVGPRGDVVIRARGIHARADVPAIVAAVIGRGQDLTITIARVRVDDAEVVVEPTATGAIGIAEAFFPKPAARTPDPPRPGAARAVRVFLPAIEVGHGSVRGLLAAPRALDADVTRLAASIRIEPEGFTLDVGRTGVVDRAFLPAKTVGTADYHLRVLPARAGGDPPVVRMWTELVAQIGAVQTQARATLENGWLTATIDVPYASPAELSSIVPGIGVVEPVTLRGEIDGPIPSFDVKVAALLHPGWGAPREIHAEGRVEASSPLRVDAEFTLRDLDPSAVDVRLPVGRIAAEGRVVGEIGPVPRLSVDARTSAGIIADQLVPPATVHLDLVHGGLVAGVTLDEPGAPIEGFVDLAPGGALAFEGGAEIPSIGAAPRLGRVAEGAAWLRVSGTLREGAIDARVAATGVGLRAGGASLGTARLRGRVRGPIGALAVEADLDAEAVSAGAYTFRTATARAEGPLLSPRLMAKLRDDDRGELKASGRLDAKRASVTGVAIDASRGEDRVTATVARLGAGAGGLALEGVAIGDRSGGSIAGDLAILGSDVTGTLRGDQVDLGSLARLVGVSLPLRGVADLDVDLAHRADGGHEGHVAVWVEQASVDGRDGFSGQITAKIEGERVTADAVVKLFADPLPAAPAASAPVATPAPGKAKPAPGTAKPAPDAAKREEPDPNADVASPAPCEGVIAKLELDGGDGTLRGPLLAAATWRDLAGIATVRASGWRLECVQHKFPISKLVAPNLAGKVDAHVTIARPRGQRFPNVVDFAIRTDGLAGVAPRENLVGNRAWRLDCNGRETTECASVDVAVAGSIDGASGAANVNLALRSELADPRRPATASGAANVNLALRSDLADPRSLATASVEATFDLATILDHPARRVASLRAAPFLAHVSLVERDTRDYAFLPAILRDRLPKLAGRVGFDAFADGTVAEPFVTIKAHGTKVEHAEAFGAATRSPWAMPFDVDAQATYNASHATIDATLKQDAVAVATLNGELDAPLDALLASLGGPTPKVTGGLHLVLGAAPARQTGVDPGAAALDPEQGGIALQGMVALADRDISGHLRGTVEITGIGRAPSAIARLRAPDLLLGLGEPVQNGILHVFATSARADVNLQFCQPANGEACPASMTLPAHTSVDWLAGIFPWLNQTASGSVDLDATRFSLGVLRPLLTPWVSNLGGAVTGTATVLWSHLNDYDSAGVTAGLTVSDAFVNVPQLGHDLRAETVLVTANGGQRIDLVIPRPAVDVVVPRPQVNGKELPPRTPEDVARAVTAKAEIELDDLGFRRGHAAVTLPADVPIAFEGVPLGGARGEIEVEVRYADHDLTFDVLIPRLHVELPASPRLGVQALDENPYIAIERPASVSRRSAAAAAPSPTKVVVTVQAKEIHIEGEAPGGGKGLDLVLRTRTQPAGEGQRLVPVALPRIEAGNTLKVGGDIEAVRGKVDIYGKLFELDEALVRLRPEDPSNPYLNVLAHWDAPDGSRITVGWNGPLDPMTDDKLLLRSDPPRAGGRPEILAALLFGVTPGESAAPATSTAEPSQGTAVGSKAVGVGGSLAAAQIGALLSGTMLRGLSARFGTTAEGSLATTLQYQVGQKVIAAATFENAGAASAASAASAATAGAPATSTTASGSTTQTSSTRANRTEISVDWRFASEWSLRATLGVAADQPNSGLDLLWQYRY